MVGSTNAAPLNEAESSENPNFIYKTNRANPNNPKIIEGTPARISTPDRAALIMNARNWLSREASLAYSTR